MLYLVYKLGIIFERKIKQLLNSTFVSCEGLWRSGRVLSTSADDTLFDLHNASYDTQPRPIIVNYHSMHFFSPLLTAKSPPCDFQLTAYK